MIWNSKVKFLAGLGLALSIGMIVMSAADAYAMDLLLWNLSNATKIPASLFLWGGSVSILVLITAMLYNMFQPFTKGLQKYWAKTLIWCYLASAFFGLTHGIVVQYRVAPPVMFDAIRTLNFLASSWYPWIDGMLRYGAATWGIVVLITLIWTRLSVNKERQRRSM